MEWLEMIGCDLPLHEAASILYHPFIIQEKVLVTNAWSSLDQEMPVMQAAWAERQYSVLYMTSVFETLKNGMQRQGGGLTKHIFHSSLIQGALADDPTFSSAKKWNQREKHDVLAEFFGACQGAQIRHDILHITDGLLNS